MNQVIGEVEHHQVNDLRRGHGRGRGTVGHRLLEGASPPLCLHPVRDLRAPATICFPRVREVGTASATSDHPRR